MSLPEPVREDRDSLCGIVVVRLNPLEFKVDEVCGVKRAGFLELHNFRSGGSRSAEVFVGTQASYPSADQVESYV